jgi:hypothetical protein
MHDRMPANGCAYDELHCLMDALRRKREEEKEEAGTFSTVIGFFPLFWWGILA